VIKRLWTEDEVTHHGRFVHLTRARMALRPVQRPHRPVWFAANNDGAVERSVRMADAWVINPHAKLAILERQIALYRTALQAAGKPWPAERPIIKELYVATTHTREERRGSIRQRIRVTVT